eukprot:7588788-Heterocapsa_arctica.AAC.2
MPSSSSARAVADAGLCDASIAGTRSNNPAWGEAPWIEMRQFRPITASSRMACGRSVLPSRILWSPVWNRALRKRAFCQSISYACTTFGFRLTVWPNGTQPRSCPWTSGSKPTEKVPVHRHAEATPSASEGATPPTASGATP